MVNNRVMVDRLRKGIDNPLIQEIVNHLDLARKYDEDDKKDIVLAEVTSAEEGIAQLNDEDRRKLADILDKKLHGNKNS